MASERQIEANRRNARLSKGPKTPEGKAAVRFNALKHGLAAEHIVLDDEERPQFDQLLAAYLAEYQPQNPTETDLVHQLVAASWRLRRLRTMETGLIELRLVDYEADFDKEYTSLRPHERLAYVFARNTEALSTLSRYEGRIERSFYRALHELQRLKAGRAGQPVPPPRVIEVNSPDDEGVNAPIGIVPSAAQTGSEPSHSSVLPTAKIFAGRDDLADRPRLRLVPAEAASVSPRLCGGILFLFPLLSG